MEVDDRYVVQVRVSDGSISYIPDITMYITSFTSEQAGGFVVSMGMSPGHCPEGSSVEISPLIDVLKELGCSTRGDWKELVRKNHLEAKYGTEGEEDEVQT